MPMAAPATIRAIIKTVTPVETAAPTAPTPKIIAVIINNLLRPSLSARNPPTKAPKSDPSKTALTTISSMPDERANSFFINRIAPEITPIS